MNISILDTRISPFVLWDLEQRPLPFVPPAGWSCWRVSSPQTPFCALLLTVWYNLYTPDVFPQNNKILGVIMGKQHFTSCKEGWPGHSIIEEALFLTQVWHMNKCCPDARHVMSPAFLQNLLHFFPLSWNAEPQQQQHKATKAKMTQKS